MFGVVERVKVGGCGDGVMGVEKGPTGAVSVPSEPLQTVGIAAVSSKIGAYRSQTDAVDQ